MSIENQLAQIHSRLETIVRKVSRMETIIADETVKVAADNLRLNGEPVCVRNVQSLLKKAGEKVPGWKKIETDLNRAGYRKVNKSEYYSIY